MIQDSRNPRYTQQVTKFRQWCYYRKIPLDKVCKRMLLEHLGIVQMRKVVAQWFPEDKTFRVGKYPPYLRNTGNCLRQLGWMMLIHQYNSIQPHIHPEGL